MNFYIFAILAAFQAVSKASNPYYYSAPQIQYQLPPAPAYNSFGNPYTTSTFYVSPHYQYRSIPAIHTPIHQIHHTPPIHQINHTPLYQNTPTVQTNHKQTYENEASDYQGFAYHTRNDNGATSHVLFVSGPQSQTIRSTLFPTFNQANINTPTFRNQDNQNYENKAKTVASSMVDSVSNKETDSMTEYPKNIQDIYQSPLKENEQIQRDPQQFFQNFFRRSEPSVVNFYSRNSNLFVRPVSGFAADTFPLLNDNARYYSPYINPRFEQELGVISTEKDDAVATTTEAENVTEKRLENVAQESVLTNTRFRINEIIDQVEKLTATTMTPIVVEETISSSSSMQPIIVEETTPVATSPTETTISNAAPVESSTSELSTSTTTTGTPSTTTTETPSTTTTGTPSTTTTGTPSITTTGTPSITTSATATTTTTTEERKEATTTEEAEETTTDQIVMSSKSAEIDAEQRSAEETDIMKSLLSLLAKDSLSQTTENIKDAATTEISEKNNSTTDDSITIPTTQSN